MIRTSALVVTPRIGRRARSGASGLATLAAALVGLVRSAHAQPAPAPSAPSAPAATPATTAPSPSSGAAPAAPPSAQPAPPPALTGAPYYPGYPPPPAYPQPASPQPYHPQPYPGVYGAPYPAYAGAQPPLAEIIEDEGQPLPAGYHREQRPRGGLVLAGIGIFAPLYAFSLTAAIGSDDARDRWLAVPLFGPLVDMLKRKSCGGDYGCDDGQRTLLGMDFLGQATGTLLFTLGYALPRDVFVRGERAADRGGKALPLLVLPGVVGGGSGAGVPGLSATGVF